MQAVLRQDAAFFDVHARSGDLLQGLNEDTSAIQLAIGEKVCAHIDLPLSCPCSVVAKKGMS